MYLLTIILLMVIFPILSILFEILVFKRSSGIVFLIGKWFVFWAVGVRLFSAGMRQSVNPKFTAERIFGIKSDEPLVIVQELGFANISLGVLVFALFSTAIGCCSLLLPAVSFMGLPV